MPFSLPILPVETYIRYSKALHFGPPKIETFELGPLPQIYAAMFGAEEMTQVVARAYNALPPEQRAKTAIFAFNYGEAGAIDLFGRKYGLPKAISGHQSYFLWGPRNYTLESIIAIGGKREWLEPFFVSVEEVGSVYHPYSMPYEHRKLYHCRGLKRPMEQVWSKLKYWD